MKITSKKAFIIKIIIVAITIIGIFFGSLWAYRQYKELKKPLLPAINAIPENTAFFIEIKNYNELRNKLNQPYSIWKTLTAISAFDEINKQILFLDSLTKTNQEIVNIINKQTVYIAITYCDNSELCPIFLVDLSEKQQSKAITKFINNFKQNEYEINDLTKNEIPFYELSALKKNKKIYYSLFKGVFIAGLSKKEVFASAMQLNNKESITQKEVFNKIYNTAGKNVDANFYMNLAFINKLASKIFIKDNSLLPLLKNIANGWLAMDIKIKENLFILNGFTNNTDSTSNLLNIFKNEEPQSINVSNIMPDNTAMFLYLSFNDFNKFGKSLTGLNNNNNESKIKDINHRYDIEIEKYFKYWIGKEILMFSITDQANEFEINNYLAINTIDKKTASERLVELARKTKTITKRDNEDLAYKGYNIYQISISELLPAFFGFMANDIKQNFFIIINNYVVFGNSTEALKQLIDKITLQQTLENNSNYNSFVENLSDKASIFLYVNIPKYLSTFIKTANPKFTNTIEQNRKTFNQFQSFALQIIPEKDLFYNTVCFDYKTVSINKPAGVLWKLDLDTTIAGKPIVLKNHANKSNEILVIDAANQLYLINKEGEKLWKRSLKEKIISDVYQIDFYKNGKLQYLFNTENYIYLIDHNSKDVESFPVKLKSKASNGMLAVYYPDISDYRIYMACENKKIICLSKEASLVEGWQFKTTENIVNKPIQHFVINKSDYLVFFDNLGKIFIVDRKGLLRIELNKDITISDKSTVFSDNNITNKETSLVFTNKRGEIIFIQLPNGKIKTVNIKEFSPDHYFLYADFNNDKKKDYIFIDNTNLEIYNQSQKLIFNYQFINPISSVPLIIEDNEQLLRIGILDNKTSQLFLFSNANNTFNMKETLPCFNFFNTSHLLNNKQLNILTVSDKTISNYVY